MQIVYHIGANCTDGERLLKSLLKNADTFAAQGIKVPGPGRYRRLIRETIQNLDGRPPEPGTRDILLDAIIDEDEAQRVVMSHSDFICVPPRIFENGQFYGLAEFKLASLKRLFPNDELELYMGIRNPATFIPAAFAASKAPDPQTFLKGLDPLALRWSDLVTRIVAALPGVPLTVWCNEDTPMIWAQLIRELSGVDPMTRIAGGFDLLAAIITEEGMRRFLTYIKAHPPQTEAQKRRIVAAFLDKFAIAEEVEDVVDLPGWTEDMVQQMTQAYEDDIWQIERIPGVTVIAP